MIREAELAQVPWLVFKLGLSCWLRSVLAATVLECAVLLDDDHRPLLDDLRVLFGGDNGNLAAFEATLTLSYELWQEYRELVEISYQQQVQHE